MERQIKTTGSQAARLAEMFSMGDKVCVVTGGSRGLGREIGLAFAAVGAKIVVASRKLEACNSVVQEITGNGGVARAVPCHVGKWDDCDHLITTTLNEFGRIDVLVNNAGMSPTYPSLKEVSEELFDKVIGVNLKGPFRLSALAADAMARTGSGSIVNISSVASVQPSKDEVPYAAAKAGLNSLTSAFAHAYAPAVRVNAILAGPFMTDISAAWDPGRFGEWARAKIPLARGGDPDEIVGAALYLASDASSYVTGAMLKVDGGVAW